jgi:hypothetical protein
MQHFDVAEHIEAKLDEKKNAHVQQKWAFVHALTCKVMKQKSGSASG